MVLAIGLDTGVLVVIDVESRKERLLPSANASERGDQSVVAAEGPRRLRFSARGGGCGDVV